MKKFIVGSLVGASLTFAAVAIAGPDKHPNLTKAHEALTQAANHITAAQKANEYDMGGHAAKAKDLIDQAIAEVKQAREAANENKK
ncbi:MAG: hypothetical protein JST54_14555 [Deltaproteobacteria bacterium]|nr:hypothetical protein [Deltaproteobacteria bacterium]